MSGYLLSDLAERLDAQLIGDAACRIVAIATLESAGAGQLSFLSNSKYRKFLAETSAAAVLISADDVPFVAPGVNALVVKDPYVAFARVAQLLDTTPAAAEGIHPTAIIDSSATLGTNVSVGAGAVVSAGVIVADNVQIGAGCFIGEQAEIGNGTKLWANVTVYHRVRIGQRCIVHSGAVLGADGFGFANERGNWLKIPQTGTVRIGDDCEIGANTTIDRGAMDDTVVGEGTKIDNQVQIAHNVKIGRHCAIASGTGIAGSTKIGDGVQIGGASGVNGHITIGDGVQIAAMSGVVASIPAGARYGGIPARPMPDFLRV